MATITKNPVTTGTGFQFLLPAEQVDFPTNAQAQQQLVTLWNRNLNTFTQQGMTGGPWNTTNASPITNYFNPLATPIPEGTPTVAIQWTVFPNRVNYYCGNAGISQQNIYSLADTGYETDKQTSFPQITNPCTQAASPYGPYGPRGWQDEYCEWSITYDDDGNITRIDFTCESPEYWNSLWMIDPQQVLQIYQDTLGKPQIQLSDLYLTDANNNPIIDPSTGNPIYNPLNKWNCGTLSTATQGGAMHLTSTPNTIQTDICLANAATILRTSGNSDPNALLCCAQYGQPMRNSDPHIGQSVNKDVATGLTISLCNPPGLYMLLPDFSKYTFPAGTTSSDYYTIVRGNETLTDQYGNQLPGNFILHAVFQAPPGFTIQQVLINKNGQDFPITWAGQIAETINNQIVAYGITAPAPTPMACVGNPTSQNTFANPLQLFQQNVFNAMSSYVVPNPVNVPMTLVSNSTLIAPTLQQGSTNVPMVLTCATTNTSPLPLVTFDGDNDISATVVSTSNITYAVPGNSYPSECTVLVLSVNVTQNAQTGLRNLYITNSGQPMSLPMPALLNIIPAN
ncbi:MAG: hypothetical protein QM737_07855 [Ferruginibacter sp.]